jgi:hypothetical protein
LVVCAGESSAEGRKKGKEEKRGMLKQGIGEMISDGNGKNERHVVNQPPITLAFPITHPLPFHGSANRISIMRNPRRPIGPTNTQQSPQAKQK